MIRSNAPDSWIAKANLAFEAACRKVIDRARQSGTEIVIWREGQNWKTKMTRRLCHARQKREFWRLFSITGRSRPQALGHSCFLRPAISIGVSRGYGAMEAILLYSITRETQQRQLPLRLWPVRWRREVLSVQRQVRSESAYFAFWWVVMRGSVGLNDRV